MSPEQYCQDKAARSGSSFYYSFMFLPADRRAAITALYAYCREVDDVVDETSDPALARAKLDWWRGEIAALFEGTPEHPVTRALAPHLARYQIRRGQLLEILDGMQMDLDQRRYPDFEALRLYCHRVAGVVGIIASRIFGATDPATERYADSLGLALQLTNIIRDVGEDARRGRIYLPLEDLRRFGVRPQELLALNPPAGFVELMRAQRERALEAYREALRALPQADRRAQRPGLVMARIYLTLLDEIDADGYRVLTHRVALTPIRKLWIAWRTWRRGQIADV